MNPIIIEHFDTYEVKLIESPAIVSYQIRKNLMFLIRTLGEIGNTVHEFWQDLEDWLDVYKGKNDEL